MSKEPLYRIGEIVYEHSAPASYGKILDMRYDDFNVYYLIRWKNGDEAWEYEHSFKSLETLINIVEANLKVDKENYLKGRNL